MHGLTLRHILSVLLIAARSLPMSAWGCQACHAVSSLNFHSACIKPSCLRSQRVLSGEKFSSSENWRSKLTARITACCFSAADLSHTAVMPGAEQYIVCFNACRVQPALASRQHLPLGTLYDGRGGLACNAGLPQRIVHEDALLEVLCRISCLVTAPAVPRNRYSLRLAARHPSYQPRG